MKLSNIKRVPLGLYEEWEVDWPKVEGMFWFCGTTSLMDTDVRLELVSVYKTGSGFAYVSGSQFMYESTVEGYWKRAELPRVPEVYS